MTSADELPLSFSVPVGPVLVLLHHGEVDGDDGVGAGLDEVEAALLVGRLEVVEEDAADAAGDTAVGDLEVAVAPGLELGVVGGVVGVAGRLQRPVEVFGVRLVKVVRGEVAAAAKPPLSLENRESFI